MYRVETGVCVGDYVVGTDVRDDLLCARRPREQLLVVEADGEMNLALYIEPGVLANLHANDPSRRLGDHNFGDFLLAIEGVSHFIYTVCCARAERPVSQLELELQAEVDKYVTCLLTTEPEIEVSAALRQRLFGDAEYEPDLDDEEHDRYRAANDNAQRYAAWLEDTFVARRRIPEMLGELRRFYRQGLAQKLSTIARAA
jgi:protein required for attachment to host cells